MLYGIDAKYLISLFQSSKFNKYDKKFSTESIFVDKSNPKQVPITIEKNDMKKQFKKNIKQIFDCFIPNAFSKIISLYFSLIKKIWFEIIVKEEITIIKKRITNITFFSVDNAWAKVWFWSSHVE